MAATREELKCAVMEGGQPSGIVVFGTTMMPKWFVDNWDFMMNVRICFQFLQSQQVCHSNHSYFVNWFS